MVEKLHSLLANNSFSSHDSQIVPKLCFPALVWTVWQERNNIIFCSKSKSWIWILLDTQKQIRARAIFLGLDVLPPFGAFRRIESPHLRKISAIPMESFDLFASGLLSCFFRHQNRDRSWIKTVVNENLFLGAASILGIANSKLAWWETRFIRWPFKSTVCGAWKNSTSLLCPVP